MRVGLSYLRHGICLNTGIHRLGYFHVQTRPRLVSLRQFSCTNHLRQNDKSREQQAQSRVDVLVEKSDSIKPESFQEPSKAKSNGPPKTDLLLSEQTVSNKEQRKADWAIMKEMARYLWPKVCRTYISDRWRKPNTACRTTWGQEPEWELH